MNLSREDTKAKVAGKFELESIEAEAYMVKFWKE